MLSSFGIIVILAITVVSILFLLSIGFSNKNNDVALLGTLLVSNIIILIVSCSMIYHSENITYTSTSNKKEEYVTLNELKIILLPITSKIRDLEKNICY